jgi:hypothetical protein
MVWEAGTASIEATSVGLGRGLFVAGSSGTQTSMLARRVAPPEPASTGFALAVVTIGVVIAITGSPIFGGSLAALFAWVALSFYRENRSRYPARLAR